MSAVIKRQSNILRTNASTREQLLQRINDGLSPSAVDRVVDLGFDRNLIYTLVSSRSTLQRRLKTSKPLDADESDRLARITEIVAMAEDVFGEKAKAMSWLQRESVDLAGQGAPIRLLATSQGTDLVKERLEQIRYGMFV